MHANISVSPSWFDESDKTSSARKSQQERQNLNESRYPEGMCCVTDALLMLSQKDSISTLYGRHAQCKVETRTLFGHWLYARDHLFIIAPYKECFSSPTVFYLSRQKSVVGTQ